MKLRKKPTFDKSVADDFYPKTYSVPPVFDTTKLNWFPHLNIEQSNELNMSPIIPKDVKGVISKKKSTSDPGPDALTYGILKHLPATHHFMATLYSKLLLKSPKPPSLWQTSKIALIYKRNEQDNPRNFRMIALTSIVGKVFHQILSSRTLEFMTNNGYIDNSMQKAFINNINGTIEHNQLLQEIIQHARHHKKTCHITFFDLKDAFGSISHE